MRVRERTGQKGCHTMMSSLLFLANRDLHFNSVWHDGRSYVVSAQADIDVHSMVGVLY